MTAEHDGVTLEKLRQSQPQRKARCSSVIVVAVWRYSRLNDRAGLKAGRVANFAKKMPIEQNCSVF